MQAVHSDHPPGAVCLVTGDLTRYALAMQSLMSLAVPPGTVNNWHTGVLIQKSLNDSLQAVLDNPTLQWAWIMGDDHVMAPDILLNLLAREKDVIAPLCLNRQPPMDPTIIEHTTKRMKYLEDLPLQGLYHLSETETCGDAGLLVRRNVLEKIGNPWYDTRKSGSLAADDQAFIQNIKDAGYEVFIDLDQQLGHIGNVTYMPVRKNGRWDVRLFGGLRHIVDLGPMARSSDKFRIAG